MLKLILKVLGFGKYLNAIEALDGMKVYIAGTVKMLTGAGMILGALATFLPHLQDENGLSGLLAALKGPELPIAKATIVAGWLVLVDGFHAIGARHAQEKAEAPAVPALPPATPPVP